jgi:hypothetical protein
MTGATLCDMKRTCGSVRASGSFGTIVNRADNSSTLSGDSKSGTGVDDTAVDGNGGADHIVARP